MQQRVLAGCPKPDALREVREHHSKFLDMVAKTYSSVGGPWAHGSARREAQLDTKGQPMAVIFPKSKYGFQVDGLLAVLPSWLLGWCMNGCLMLPIRSTS